MQNRVRLAAVFPQFAYAFDRGTATATWQGTLQPRDESPSYEVRVTYKMGKHRDPRVTVLSPPIRTGAPHRYPDGSLCLYYPRDRSWHEGLYIADTIIPWAAMWLYFYELWCDTEIWWGSAAPHGSPGPPR